MNILRALTDTFGGDDLVRARGRLSVQSELSTSAVDGLLRGASRSPDTIMFRDEYGRSCGAHTLHVLPGRGMVQYCVAEPGFVAVAHSHEGCRQTFDILEGWIDLEVDGRGVRVDKTYTVPAGGCP